MKIFVKIFFYFCANFKKTKNVFAKISYCFPVISKRSTRISKGFGIRGQNNWEPTLTKKLGLTSLPSTAALNTYSMYVLVSPVTNSTIVQPSQSQAVQLYEPPTLHIYKRKLKIIYFLSLVAYNDD